MKKLALALWGLLLLSQAQAQTNFSMPPPAGVMVGGYQVVTTCGTGSLSTTTPAFGTMDTTGKLCTSGSASGGSSLAYVSATLTPWTSATAANATQLLMPLNTTSFGAAIAVQLDQTTTISAGAVTFEGTYDGTNWVTVPIIYTQNPASICSLLTNPYTLVASTNQSFLILPTGYQSVRIRLSTQITGSGSVTPFVTLLPFLPVDPALCNPLSAQSGAVIIGGVVPNPTANSASALTDVVCGSAVSSCIFKASSGNLYGAYAECTSACWLMIFNAVSAPSNGATTAGKASGNLVDCIDISAGSSKSITYPTFPINYSVGITAAISSTACATLTLSTVGFVHGTVQ